MSKPGQHPNTGVSLTQQNFKQAADVNNVIARVTRGGSLINPGATRQPRYMDLSNLGDYHELLNQVMSIEMTYNSLPGRMRKYFRDPSHLVRWVSEPANRQKALQMGLLQPQNEQEAAIANPPRQPRAVQQDMLTASERSELEAFRKANPMPKADPEANPRKQG